MQYQLKYVNSKGDEIEFGGSSSPWRLGATDIFNIEQEYRSTGGRITSFRHGIRELSLTVWTHHGTLAERDRLVDVISYDTAVGEPGTLYAGSSYMRCWIPAASIADWQYIEGLYTADLTVLSDEPVWVREHNITIAQHNGENYGGLNFPHTFPHNYLYVAGTSEYIENPFQLPAKVDIVFPGACPSPYVNIAGNRYQVDMDVQAGELLMIKGYGRKRDIVIRDAQGNDRSVLSRGVRQKGAHVFAKVPPGKSVASWFGAHNIGITLYEERLSPCWQM